MNLSIVILLFVACVATSALKHHRHHDTQEDRIPNNFMDAAKVLKGPCILDSKTAGSNHHSFWLNRCESRNVEFCDKLYDELMPSFFNQTFSPCKNMHSFACTGDSQLAVLEKYLDQLERDFAPVTILDRLTTEPTEFGPYFKSALVEMKMYENCIKYDERGWVESFVQEIEDKSAKHTWLDIDEMINIADYVFFDVSVTYHPNDFHRKVILLQPHSADSEYMKNIINVHDYETSSDTERTDSHVQFVKSYYQMYHDCLKSEDQYDLTTIKQLNRLYNNGRNYSDQSVKLDWMRVFTKSFDSLNVDITEKEVVIVKNMKYFEGLAYLLEDASDDQIEFLIETKLYAENMGYDGSARFGDVDEKKQFCSKEIEIFGSTYNYIRAEMGHVKFEPEARHMLLQIMKVYGRKLIEQGEEAYQNFLKIHIYEASEALLKGTWSKESVDNYYGSFAVSGNYMQDIRQYRDVVKRALLGQLRDTSDKALRPLSAADKYLAKTFITGLHQVRSQDKLDLLALRGTYFGFQGFHMARDLFEFLLGKVPHVKRLAEAFQNQTSREEYEEVKDQFALEVAYEAMFDNCYKHRTAQYVEFPYGKSIPFDILYFMTYIKTHCAKYDDDKMEKILLDLKSYNHAFNCKSI